MGEYGITGDWVESTVRTVRTVRRAREENSDSPSGVHSCRSTRAPSDATLEDARSSDATESHKRRSLCKLEVKKVPI